ncbi:hypothetical protein SAMN05444166_3809 [Singulisphaera sp. GP187]|uniref:hypothetical protein n=1 Tax=Singulisphaera sp. GP187 TaxID=1882752 RepID=UPI000925D715|nr:hypothetical protein [Singulisphaera sp. GP187]SIO32677.1 hypothetical protein SAMN05444166_3809 [Singulisphaera sp. GP187]
MSPIRIRRPKEVDRERLSAGRGDGLSVWCADQAGPFQSIPYPGQSWYPEGEPVRKPHEYLRDGTAKILTLFRLADGRVRIE